MFRKYGTWVARNPTLVLCSSLAMVLLLCLGLIRFKVETRPEKVWFVNRLCFAFLSNALLKALLWIPIILKFTWICHMVLSLHVFSSLHFSLWRNPILVGSCKSALQTYSWHGQDHIGFGTKILCVILRPVISFKKHRESSWTFFFWQVKYIQKAQRGATHGTHDVYKREFLDFKTFHGLLFWTISWNRAKVFVPLLMRILNKVCRKNSETLMNYWECVSRY
jgi:hypothetical protein